MIIRCNGKFTATHPNSSNHTLAGNRLFSDQATIERPQPYGTRHKAEKTTLPADRDARTDYGKSKLYSTMPDFNLGEDPYRALYLPRHKSFTR